MTFDIHIKKIVPKIILSPQGHYHKYAFILYYGIGDFVQAIQNNIISDAIVQPV